MPNKNLYILVVSGLLLFFCKQDTRGKYIKELNNETLVTTVYERLMELYIDGQLQPLINGDNWELPDYTQLQPTNRLIALYAANLGNIQCGGVLASVYDGSPLTNDTWKCAPYDDGDWTNLGFDDSSWPNAVEYGSNGNHSNCDQQLFIGNINSNSEWIWTNDLNDFVAYCRGYLPFCENSSPCLNNGTCLKNDERFCNCLPQFTGTYCETELYNETLVITAYEQLTELYIDGVVQSTANSNNWNRSDYLEVPPMSRLIAVKVNNNADPLCGGIIASIYEAYALINSNWKCSTSNDDADWTHLGYNDSSWAYAFVYGSNVGGHAGCDEKQFIVDIDPYAQWIWTNNPSSDLIVYCRGYLPFCENSSPCLNSGTCLMNDVNFCQCSPQFTGTFCETEIFETLETTEMTTEVTTTEETTHSETTESIITSNLQSTAPQDPEETTFRQTTHEIFETLEATQMITGMMTAEETTHSETTESITTSNLQSTDPQATEVTTFPRTTQKLMDETLVITAYQQLELMYIDGIEQPLINGNMWNQTDRAGLTEINRLVAVKVLGNETCGGILASVGDTYFLTNAEWKCSPYNFANWYILGFDDSQEYWFNAVEFGSNADGHTRCSHLQDVPDISANATWIWVADQTEKTIYCRGYMPVCDTSPCQNNGTCLQNNVKICSCLPQFTGTYCETDQAQRGF